MMTQAETARLMGISDAAVCQYLKKKRGRYSVVEELPAYPDLLAEIKRSARLVAEEGSEYELQICRLCKYVVDSGILEEVYKKLGEDPLSCTFMGFAVE